MSLPKKTFHFQLSRFAREARRATFHFKLKPGFSLIELLVVIAIMGILISFSSASWTNVQQKSRDGKRKSDIKAVQQALESFYQQNGKYPATSSGSIQCNITGDTSTKTWGTGVFSCGANTFMQQLPSDPTYQSTNGYYYNSNNSATPPNITYVISANLENNSDPELATLPCTPQASRDYCVTNP